MNPEEKSFMMAFGVEIFAHDLDDAMEFANDLWDLIGNAPGVANVTIIDKLEEVSPEDGRIIPVAKEDLE